MFKRSFSVLIVFFIFSSAYSQLFTFAFTGTGTCPVTQGNSVTNPSNATVTSFSRATGLSCEVASNAFNTKGWSGNVFNASQYIEVTITPSAGYSLALSSVSYTTQKSGSGPTTGRISHNALGSFNTNITPDYSISQTAPGTSVMFDFPDFVGIPGQAITFRIYGWGATDAGGTMRITNFSVFGVIAQNNSGGTNSLLTFDNSNNYVGVNQPAPGYTLDVKGRLNVSDNVFARNKVLIGDNIDITKVSQYSLAVKGSVVAEKLVVRTYNNWPDYVFSSKYKLKSLDSLEDYITSNHHLPDLPTAEVIKKEGIDLGENQALLLKKVEELTLYLIAQNKKQEENNAFIYALKIQLIEQQKTIEAQAYQMETQKQMLQQLKATIKK